MPVATLPPTLIKSGSTVDNISFRVDKPNFKPFAKSCATFDNNKVMFIVFQCLKNRLFVKDLS